jgi:hypothetical protein
MDQFLHPTAFHRDTASDPDAPLKDMLASQAQSLDALFDDLIGHAAANITEFPLASDAYARLAFRAQANCRASIEAMSRLRYREALAARHEAGQ